jgi:hypothetical protein
MESVRAVSVAAAGARRPCLSRPELPDARLRRPTIYCADERCGSRPLSAGLGMRLAWLCLPSLAGAQLYTATLQADSHQEDAARFDALRAAIDPAAGRDSLLLCVAGRCASCDGPAARALTAGLARGEVRSTPCADARAGGDTRVWRVADCGGAVELTAGAPHAPARDADEPPRARPVAACVCSGPGDTLTLRPGAPANWGGHGASCRRGAPLEVSLALGPATLAALAASCTCDAGHFLHADGTCQECDPGSACAAAAPGDPCVCQGACDACAADHWMPYPANDECLALPSGSTVPVHGTVQVSGSSWITSNYDTWEPKLLLTVVFPEVGHYDVKTTVHLPMFSDCPSGESCESAYVGLYDGTAVSGSNKVDESVSGKYIIAGPFEKFERVVFRHFVVVTTAPNEPWYLLAYAAGNAHFQQYAFRVTSEYGFYSRLSYIKMHDSYTYVPLPGPQGDDGADGPAGANGTDGAAGADGADGAPGAALAPEHDPLVVSCSQCLNQTASKWCMYEPVLILFRVDPPHGCFAANYSCGGGVPVAHAAGCVTGAIPPLGREFESAEALLRRLLDTSEAHNSTSPLWSHPQSPFVRSLWDHTQQYLSRASNATTFGRPPCVSVFDAAAVDLGPAGTVTANFSAAAALAVDADGLAVRLHAAGGALASGPSCSATDGALLHELGAGAVQDVASSAGGAPSRRLLLEITNVTAAGAVAVLATRPACSGGSVASVAALAERCSMCAMYIIGDSRMMDRQTFLVEVLARRVSAACEGTPAARRSFMALDVDRLRQLAPTFWLTAVHAVPSASWVVPGLAPLFLGSAPSADDGATQLPFGAPGAVASFCSTVGAPACAADAISAAPSVGVCVGMSAAGAPRLRASTVTGGAWWPGAAHVVSDGPIVLTPAVDCTSLAPLPHACPLVRRLAEAVQTSPYGDVPPCDTGAGPGPGGAACYCATFDANGTAAAAYFLPPASDSFEITTPLAGTGAVARVPLRVGPGVGCNHTAHGEALQRLAAAAGSAAAEPDPLAALWARHLDVYGDGAQGCLAAARRRLRHCALPANLTASPPRYASRRCSMAGPAALPLESGPTMVARWGAAADPCCAPEDGQPHDACCTPSAGASGAAATLCAVEGGAAGAALAARAFAAAGGAVHPVDGVADCASTYGPPLRGWSAQRVADTVDWCRRAVWASAAASPCLLRNLGQDCAVAPPFSALCLPTNASAPLAEGVCSVRPQALDGTLPCANATEDEQRRVYRCLRARGAGLRDLPSLDAAPAMAGFEAFREATARNASAQGCAGPDAWAYTPARASFADPAAAWAQPTGCVAAPGARAAHAAAPRVVALGLGDAPALAPAVGPAAAAARSEWPASLAPAAATPAGLGAADAQPPLSPAALAALPAALAQALLDFDLRLPPAAAETAAVAAPRRVQAPAAEVCALPPQRVYVQDRAGGLAVEVRCPNLLADCHPARRAFPPLPPRPPSASGWPPTAWRAADHPPRAATTCRRRRARRPSCWPGRCRTARRSARCAASPTTASAGTAPARSRPTGCARSARRWCPPPPRARRWGRRGPPA